MSPKFVHIIDNNKWVDFEIPNDIIDDLHDERVKCINDGRKILVAMINFNYLLWKQPREHENWISSEESIGLYSVPYEQLLTHIDGIPIGITAKLDKRYKYLVISK